MTGAVLGRVVSVRTGRVERRPRPDWDHVRSEWHTAFWKHERQGPVRVDTLGLEGDEQADRRHHGGPHRAVLMYAAAHYAHWRAREGFAAMGPGGFGENLAVEGCDETSVCAGDQLGVGGATLEVASPRGPCRDISRRWNADGLLKRVVELRHTGWYLRVPAAGVVEAGDEVRLLARPHPGWTVDRLLRLRYLSPRAAPELAEASSLEALAPDWRERFAALPPRD